VLTGTVTFHLSIGALLGQNTRLHVNAELMQTRGATASVARTSHCLLNVADRCSVEVVGGLIN
jgi:hypothetical protein